MDKMNNESGFGFFEDSSNDLSKSVAKELVDLEKKKSSVPAHTSDQRYLVFRLGEHNFATPLLYTREVIEPVESRPVPNAMDYFCGIANIRGEVVGIINLSKKLGVMNSVEEPKQAVIVFDTDSGPLGAVVDEIKNVIYIENNLIDTEPHIKSKVPQKYLLGVAKLEDDLIALVDLKKIINEDELVKIRKYA